MKKEKFIIPGVLTLVSIIYTLMIKFIDVKAIGPKNSEVGFATINKGFRNFIGTNDFFKFISEISGYLLILLVVMYAVLGIRQLIKRKSIKKVDKEIIILGCFYVLVLVVFAFFEKCIINYRPILENGTLEASYPSTHTLLSLCVGLSALIVNKKYIKGQFVGNFNKVVMVLMSITLLFRIISGVHWITDIIGGLIISVTLLSYFYTAYTYDKE